MRSAIVIGVLLLLVLPQEDVQAQEGCEILLYGSPDAEWPGVRWEGFELGVNLAQLDIYYVLYVEDFVRGLAWSRRLEAWSYDGNMTIDVVGAVQHYDPLEQFLEVTEHGFRMGLGQCQVGFGGQRIVVLHETLILERGWSGPAPKAAGLSPGYGMYIWLGPNPLEDPEYPVYADCSPEATKKRCSVSRSSVVENGNAQQSWGAIKATYR